ncbi:hypothetical protein AAVH_41264 [Aphelenchoides avenae]|nr:hypothetical protein AAVH_41264 [Aphelenchus avenae]
MDLMDYMESRKLCYVGDDLARDCFEFYVRLLYHFEYATHVIVLRQWGVQQAFDAVDVLMRQASSFQSWLEDRWIPSEDSSCLKYALLQTPVDPSSLLSQLPLQDYLLDPYTEDIRKYVMTSPPWR